MPFFKLTDNNIFSFVFLRKIKGLLIFGCILLRNTECLSHSLSPYAGMLRFIMRRWLVDEMTHNFRFSFHSIFSFFFICTLQPISTHLFVKSLAVFCFLPTFYMVQLQFFLSSVNNRRTKRPTGMATEKISLLLSWFRMWWLWWLRPRGKFYSFNRRTKHFSRKIKIKWRSSLDSQIFTFFY